MRREFSRPVLGGRRGASPLRYSTIQSRALRTEFLADGPWKPKTQIAVIGFRYGHGKRTALCVRYFLSTARHTASPRPGPCGGQRPARSGHAAWTQRKL